MFKTKGVFLLIWQATPRLAIARLIILFIQGILPLVSLYLTKLIVDVLAANVDNSDKIAVFNELIWLLLLVAIVTIIVNVCNSLGEMVNAAQSQRVTDYVESVLYRQAMAIDIEYYETPRYLDILQRAQRAAPYKPVEILQHLTLFVQNVISFVGVVALLLSLNWIIAAVLFAAAVPAMIVKFKYAGKLYHWYQQKTEVERQSSYFAWILTSDTLVKEIRLFNFGHIFVKRFLKLKALLYQEQLGILKKRTVANLIVQVVSAIMLLGAYSFIIYQTVIGTLKLGDLVLYHQGFNRGQHSLASLITNLSRLYGDNLFLANLNEFLELKPKLIRASNPQAVPKPIQQGIVFDNVSFSYPNSSRVALKNINLTIKPGETIALVGENGSGKTTLVKLICRLYDVSQGSITIDGLDVRQIEPSTWQRHISAIFQDFGCYNLSARDNIWLGDIELDPADDRVIDAARRSGADEVIKNLKHGYENILGKQFGEGEELSGGQWQKIALSRAFLRDSQVIILDEPTSAMDPKAEEKVFSKFREPIENQAAILVTHRLSTVTMADCIYVMSDGLIAESGTHQELMNLKGIYADLFETQAKNYGSAFN